MVNGKIQEHMITFDIEIDLAEDYRQLPSGLYVIGKFILR